MKLLFESNNEVTFDQKTTDDGKHYYLEGIFLQANIKNRNGRIYPMAIMEKEVERYKKECIDGHTALGELGHPSGEGATSINFENVSHIIEDVWKDGDYFKARARILDTPKGKIVQELIRNGVQLGVSSRALGSVEMNKDGVAVVQDDFHLIALADIVSQPSAAVALPAGLYESTDDYEFDPATNEYKKVNVAEQQKLNEEYQKKKTEIQVSQFKQLIKDLTCA